jgi:hypothetical protein
MLTTRRIIFLFSVLISISLTACGPSDSELTPTLDPNMIRTEAAMTFAAELTHTALAQPSPTSTLTLTPTNTPAPFATSSNNLLQPTSSVPLATQGCYRLQFITDVTIPDNTVMTPAQTFTKTWRVKNTGTCNWDTGFKLAFTGGDSMSGTTLSLANPVTPNSETDLSVSMTAPSGKTGSIRGNWRMSTASGQYFGDEIYVVINVGGTTGTKTITPTVSGGSSGATSTSTATPTPTFTPTFTPTTPAP